MVFQPNLSLQSGSWNYDHLRDLRLDVVHGFIEMVERHNWSSEICCHLIQLAVHLMYTAQAGKDKKVLLPCASQSVSMLPSHPFQTSTLEALSTHLPL